MFSLQKTECPKASVKPVKGPTKVTNGIVLPKVPADVNQAKKETDVPKVGTDDTVLIF